MKPKVYLRANPLLTILLLLGLAGCGGEPPAPEPDHGGEHVHAAPHGGILVELGDHAANVEVVMNAEAGSFHLYLLDAHAENPVRVSDEVISAWLFLYREPRRDIEFRAVASSLTGETVGDTSEFEYRGAPFADYLVERIIIRELTLRGMTYKNVVVAIDSDDEDSDHDKLEAIADEH